MSKGTNHVMAGLTLFSVVQSIWGQASASVPEGIVDVRNAVWVTADDPVGNGSSIKAPGARGTGLTLLLASGEGKLETVTIDGRKAWQLAKAKENENPTP